MGASETKRNRITTCACAVVTVSAIRSINSDISGKTIRRLLEDDGHTVLRAVIVRNRPRDIAREIRLLAADMLIQAVVVTGGTGLGPDDVTIEAIEPLIEKRIDGFGEYFRRLAFKRHGPSALRTRAFAGVIEETVVFSLPGAPLAVELGMRELILPELVEIVSTVRGADA